MTAPRMVIPQHLAHHFEPGLAEPMAEQVTPRPVSRYGPASSVAEANQRVVTALRALRKATDEVMALPTPEALGRLVEPYAGLHHRREACGELLDRALADVERLERINQQEQT